MMHRKFDPTRLRHISERQIANREPRQIEPPAWEGDELDRCERCGGTGFVEELLSECEECDGTGVKL